MLKDVRQVVGFCVAFLVYNDARNGAKDEALKPVEPDGGAMFPLLAVDEFIAMDVSFISATLVLPAVIRAASACPQIVVLVKPQFEAGRELVGKGGIVRDESAQRAAIARVEAALLELGCKRAEWIESPILGGEGNREFLLHAEFSPPIIG